MDSVNKTLSSTQHLLEAIEQDDSLLDDQYFMRKLEYLRMKHRETSDFLARILQKEECLPPSTSTCTCNGGHFALPSEWSFSGSVSAKIVTKNGKERAHSAKSATRKKQQEMARAALEAYSSIERKVEEKRQQQKQQKAEKQSREKLHRKSSKEKKSYEKTTKLKQDWEQCYSETREQIERLKHQIEDEEFYREMEMESRRRQEEQDDSHEESSEQKSPKQTVNAENNQRMLTSGKEVVQYEPSERKEKPDKVETNDESKNVTIIAEPVRQVRSKSMVEIRKPKTYTTSFASTSKRAVVPKPVENFVPQITVPQPFKVSTRKPIVNTYSTKFVEQMVSKKKEEEEQEQNQASKSKPFTAHTVPLSTYISTNPRVMDKAYVDAIRKRLTANLRKHFQEEAQIRKSKSLGDISNLARPVPLSTYVPPNQLPDYRRARSANRRSVKLLVDAKTPALNNEHEIRSNVSTKVRHILCVEGNKERKHPRPEVPNFHKLHEEMEERLKNAPHKAVTVPRPFHLSESAQHRHEQCKSTSPPRNRARYTRKDTKNEVVVRSTHSSKIRMEAIRQREQKLYEERHKSQKFWEERKDEMDMSRMKLLSSIGSLNNVHEDIERKTAEKRKHIRETTKEYERYLAEMQQRIIDRPLIMEQQVVLAQKQKFARQFDKRMAEVDSEPKTQQTLKMLTERKGSDISAGTYSVKSKSEQTLGDEELTNGTYAIEQDSLERKEHSSRASSASSLSSSSSSSSSESGSSTSSSSSRSHHSSGSRSEGSDSHG